MKFTIKNIWFSLLCALSVWGPETDASRLPGDTVPESYDLRFDVLSSGAENPNTFAAVARITTTVRTNTKMITLNARDLDVKNVTVTNVSQMTARPIPLRVRGWMISAHDERLEILMDVPVIKEEKLQVTVKYVGQIRSDNTGLYSTTTDGSLNGDGDKGRTG